MRLGDRKSVTDYAHRRIIDQSARRRLPPGPVDFMAINESNRRDCRSTDRLQFNTLRDKRTGDENRPLFNFLLTFGGLVSPWGRRAPFRQTCWPRRELQRLKISGASQTKLHPGRCGVQIIETMTMAPPRPKQERQWLLPLPLRRPNQNVSVRISSLGARKRNGR